MKKQQLTKEGIETSIQVILTRGEVVNNYNILYYYEFHQTAKIKPYLEKNFKKMEKKAKEITRQEFPFLYREEKIDMIFS